MRRVYPEVSVRALVIVQVRSTKGVVEMGPGRCGRPPTVGVFIRVRTRVPLGTYPLSESWVPHGGSVDRP